MIDCGKMHLLRDEDGYVISNKENAKSIAEYFLKELNYQAVLDVDNTSTSAHLLRYFGLDENCTADLPLTAKEKKEKGEWRLIDLILYRINKEYKTRVSAKNLEYFADKVRDKIKKDDFFAGLKDKDYYMLHDLAESGTSFTIKFASLFCKLVCAFHPDFGEDYRDHFIVADFKRLAKISENPQELLIKTAYMRYIDELKAMIELANVSLSANGQIATDADKLTLTEMWLLELLW